MQWAKSVPRKPPASASGSGSQGCSQSESSNRSGQKRGPPQYSGKGKGKKGKGDESSRRFRFSAQSELDKIKALTKTNSRLSLRTARTVRALASHGQIVGLSPVNDAVIAVSEVADQSDAAIAQCRRWGVLVNSLLEETKISKEDKSVIAEHAAMFPDAESLLGKVQTCTAYPTHDDVSIYLVQLNVSSDLYSVAAAMIRALATLGTTFRYGPAPRDAAERLVSDLLAQID